MGKLIGQAFDKRSYTHEHMQNAPLEGLKLKTDNLKCC